MSAIKTIERDLNFVKSVAKCYNFTVFEVRQSIESRYVVPLSTGDIYDKSSLQILTSDNMIKLSKTN